MIKFYYSGAPNPTKVALFLEEAGVAYEPIPVDTRKGDQQARAARAAEEEAGAPQVGHDQDRLGARQHVVHALAEIAVVAQPIDHELAAIDQLLLLAGKRARHDRQNGEKNEKVRNTAHQALLFSRHCEERSDEAIQRAVARLWIDSLRSQ